MVPKRQLLDRRARRKGHQLVAQADAKHRHLPHQLARRLRGRLNLGGVARPVREEHAIRRRAVLPKRKHAPGRRVPRHHDRLAPHGGESVRDAALFSAVVRHHAEAPLPRRRHHVLLRGRYVRHEVVARYAGRLTHARHKAPGVKVLRRDRGAHGARRAYAQRERAGVHALDRDDTALAQQVRKAALALPVAGLAAHVAHHQARKRKPAGLHGGGAHAVVSHLRIRERHDLPRVAGVAHDLLVARHRSVEHDFPKGLSPGAGAPAPIHRAVLKRQKRLCRPFPAHKWVHSTILSVPRAKKRDPTPGGIPNHHLGAWSSFTVSPYRP